MIEKISKSQIKAESLKFVKERFGCTNLKNSDPRIDLKSHRISFEAAVSIFLKKMGYTDDGRYYTLDKSLKSDK